MNENKEHLFLLWMKITLVFFVGVLLGSALPNDAQRSHQMELENIRSDYQERLQAYASSYANSKPRPAEAPANTTFWKYTDESGQVFYTNKKTGDQAAEQVLILHPKKN